MSFTLHVRNLHALRAIRWSPEGVACLVGPNGGGKTTTILALKLLRAAYERDLPSAIVNVLGGSSRLRNAGAPEGEPIELGLDVGSLSWRVELAVQGSSVAPFAAETVHDGGKPLLVRPASSKGFDYMGNPFAGDDRLAIRAVSDAFPEDPALRPLTLLLKGIGVLHDPDLYGLRINGSRLGPDKHLHSRGQNAFSLLRHWSERRDLRQRYDFVLSGLRAAFPDTFADLDFDAAGQTVSVRVYRPHDEVPVSITHEADGLISMLVQLSAIASTDDGGVVAIDEPERSLHPFAIRELLRRARQYARKHTVTILFTTHSPVVLNEFREEPHRLFVMQPGQAVPMGGDPPYPPAQPVLPIALDQYRNPEWLASFDLGDLYANYDFGASAA